LERNEGGCNGYQALGLPARSYFGGNTFTEANMASLDPLAALREKQRCGIVALRAE
jgi:hypothetical protein